MMDSLPRREPQAVDILVSEQVEVETPISGHVRFRLKPHSVDIACEERLWYMDGVLRIVSRTDEEWARLFSPLFEVESLEHFAWPGENEETCPERQVDKSVRRISRRWKG
jgi:hypothetical protein